MPQVPLNDLCIEIEHSYPPAQLANQLEAFAQDLTQNQFSEWGVRIERKEEQLKLVGRRGGTHFDALVEPQEGRVRLSLAGSIELGRLKLTLAGGAAGVRRRVRDVITNALQRHLA